MAAASTTPRAGRHRTRTTRDDLHATKRETARYYREVAANDPHRAAYEAGLANGDRPGPEEPDSVHEAFQMGLTEHHARKSTPKAAPPKPTAPSPAPASSGQSIEVAHQGAGFLLGMVAFALTVNYLEYGWAGVTGWFSAKFLNKVTISGRGSGAFNLTPPTAARGAMA